MDIVGVIVSILICLWKIMALDIKLILLSLLMLQQPCKCTRNASLLTFTCQEDYIKVSVEASPTLNEFFVYKLLQALSQGSYENKCITVPSTGKLIRVHFVLLSWNYNHQIL